jgi:hypothetical protein
LPAWLRFNRALIAKAEANDSPRRMVLDMDSTEIPVYRRQKQRAYKWTLRVDPLSPAAVV